MIKNYVTYSHLDEKSTVNSAPNSVRGSNLQITYNFFYHEKRAKKWVKPPNNIFLIFLRDVEQVNEIYTGNIFPNRAGS